MAGAALLLAHVGPNAGAGAAPEGEEGSDGKIVFTIGLDIYTMVLDGSDPELIIPSDPPDIVTYPEWSPGGTHIVYRHRIDGVNEIHVMNADGSDNRRLSAAGQDGDYPTWSPDGQQVAWTASTGLVIADADTGAVSHTIPEPPGTTVLNMPSWSPDGTKLAVSVWFPGTPATNRIAVFPAEGGEPTYLTDGPHDNQPHWSPDGTQVAFQGRDTLGDPHEVRIVSATGAGGEESVSPPDRSFRISDWAPSGAIFATEVISDGSSDDHHVYRMNPDGSDLTLVADDADNSNNADWASTACSQHPFSDVPPWVDAAVDWAWCGQYMEGYQDGTFRPSLPITRAQVARLLYRVEGSPDMSEAPDPPWPDSPPWIADAAKWIAVNGYMDGYADGTFRPAQPIKRGEVVRLVWRVEGEPEGPPNNPFSDVPAWITPAVNWAAEDPDGDGPGTGLVTGYADDTFRHRENITRAATVRMVCRANTSPGTC